MSTDIGSGDIELTLYDGAGLKAIDDALIAAFEDEVPQRHGRHPLRPRRRAGPERPPRAGVRRSARHRTDQRARRHRGQRPADRTSTSTPRPTDGTRFRRASWRCTESVTTASAGSGRSTRWRAASCSPACTTTRTSPSRSGWRAADDAGRARGGPGRGEGCRGHPDHGREPDWAGRLRGPEHDEQHRGSRADQRLGVQRPRRDDRHTRGRRGGGDGRGWADDGYFNEDTNGTDATAALGRFAKGESLFFFSGSWDASALQDQMGDNVGFVLAPVGESGAPPLGMSDPVSNFGIPAQARMRRTRLPPS